MRRSVKVKDIILGDGKVTVQTMLSKSLDNVAERINEIKVLKDNGCDIVRIALSNMDEVANFKKVCEKSPLPIVADIQRNHLLALKAIESGASKIRINPAYIGGKREIAEIVSLAKEFSLPIRVGINMGSLEKSAEKTYGRTYKGLGFSAINCAKMLQELGFEDIVLSVKASDVKTMVSACRLIDGESNFPQHIGVTEAGTLYTGIIKNSVGIGSLLLDGIGDTIRVSLSSSPIDEVKAGVSLLKALNLRDGVKVISCPTCSRCNYDLFSLAKEIEDLTSNINSNLKIGVMGCVVNGVGENLDTDLGIVGVEKGFVVFKKGEVYAKIDKERGLTPFIEMVKEEINGKA